MIGLIVTTACRSTGAATRDHTLTRIKTGVRILPEVGTTAPQLDIRGALATAAMGMAFAEASLHQVVVTDSLGREVARLGREGSGTAEFREPQLVAFWGDSLAVFDPPQRRLSYLRHDGSLIRERTISIPGAIAPAVLGIRADGAVIFKGSFFESEADEGALIPARGMVLSIDPADQVDTIATMADGLWHPRGFRFYAWRSAAAPSDTGLWSGEGGSPTVRFVAWDGRTTASFRWDAATRAVGETDRAAMVEMAGERRAAPDLTAADRFADSIPYFARLLPETAGGVWVIGFAAPFAAPDSAWRIDERAGTLQGIRLPTGFRPTEIGADFILGVRTTEEGEVRVIRFRLSH